MQGSICPWMTLETQLLVVHCKASFKIFWLLPVRLCQMSAFHPHWRRSPGGTERQKPTGRSTARAAESRPAANDPIADILLPRHTALMGIRGHVRRVAAMVFISLAALPIVFCIYASLYAPVLLLMFFPGLIISALLARGGLALWKWNEAPVRQ